MPRASQPSTDGLTDTWGRANRSLMDRACPTCGAVFRPARAASRYCSRPCIKRDGRALRKPEGWWINSKGYIEGFVRIGDVRRGVKQHRYFMELHLERPLLRSEDVHHIDGNKQNNDLSNLMLVAHGEHTRITNSERTYKRGYRLNLSPEQRGEWADRARQHLSRARGDQP